MVSISEKTIQIIHDSAGMITKYSEEITLRMYELLFAKYPEFKIIFKNAPANQHMKVAEALSAYAVNIKKIEILLPALNVIAQSHHRHNVKVSHYPVLGMILLRAFEDILKEKFTPQLADAWREAYKYIASRLITLELELATHKH